MQNSTKIYDVLILVLMEYGLRGSDLWRPVCEPFTTKKTQNPKILRENMYLWVQMYKGFFELIV